MYYVSVMSNVYKEDIIPVELEGILADVDDIIDQIASNFDDEGNLKNKQDLNIPNTSLKCLGLAQDEATKMYTLNTLMWILMKLNGIDPLKYYSDGQTELTSSQYSTLIRELQRVQRSITTVKDTEKLLSSAKINQDAAKRMIKHGLGNTENND